MNAYLDAIEKAKKYIYIENQYFISNCDKGGVVKNTIVKAIKNRIIRAWSNNEPFLVIIFIPLMPGFEGDVTKSESAVLKCILKYQLETISRGPKSLYELLKKEGIEDPFKYVRFYGLRQHVLAGDTPKEAIIYIHSKLMIVDDRKVTYLLLINLDFDWISEY